MLQLVAADLSRDGKPDLILSGGAKELIGKDPTTKEEKFRYSGLVRVDAKGKRQWAEPRQVNGPKASSIAVGDLNADGLPDVVMTDAGAESNGLHILWGDQAGEFAAKPATTLDVPYASAAAIADLDGDKKADLVVGVNQTKETWQAGSRVYHGDGKGGFKMADVEIPTARPNRVLVAPPDAAHSQRIVFCNAIWGRINEDVPVLVYWGQPGGFDPNRVSEYHNRAGFSSNATDLNNDGFTDLIIMAAVHAVTGDFPYLGFNILWGSPAGPMDDGRTIVPEYGLASTNVADLDRDGYLDLVGTCNVAHKEDPTRVVTELAQGFSGVQSIGSVFVKPDITDLSDPFLTIFLLNSGTGEHSPDTDTILKSVGRLIQLFRKSLSDALWKV